MKILLSWITGSKTIDVVANASAKDVAEAVNIAFDSTGVSATASTNLKIQGLADSGSEGSATLSIGIQGKILLLGLYPQVLL